MNDLTEITTRLICAYLSTEHGTKGAIGESEMLKAVEIARTIINKTETAPIAPSYHGTELHKKLQDEAKQLNEALAASKKRWAQNGTRIYDGNGVFVYDTGCTLMSQGVCDAHNRRLQS